MLRLFGSIILGAAVAFGLFFIMAKLVENTGEPGEAPPPAPIINIIMQEPDEATNTRVRTPPPPPPPPQEPPKVEVVEPDTSEPDMTGFSLNIPSVNTGSVGVNIGGIGAMQDGEATPIFRIDPKYPPEAARDGKEGWVQLSFTINEVGGVEDVEVIDAEPKRIFDREAKRALRKWKYKPKVEDGVAMRQPGLKVRLDFTLDNG